MFAANQSPSAHDQPDVEEILNQRFCFESSEIANKFHDCSEAQATITPIESHHTLLTESRNNQHRLLSLSPNVSENLSENSHEMSRHI